MNLRIIPLLMFLVGCAQPTTFTKADDAEEAGREFIRASLDGNYEKARFYLYNDSTDANIRFLEKWKTNYDALPDKEKSNYKDASIRPIEIKKIDSTNYTYTYFNSYKKDTTTIRIVKVNDAWLVDVTNIH